jgi:TFIIF-interacting CTD phosphatase-like protein
MLVTKRLNSVAPETDNQSAIIEHLRNQIKFREQKFQMVADIKERSGISNLNLDPRSVLDRAMARKNSRGAARPKR